ncbi:hypothetical protein FHS27_001293 [Rhodopirellula rubra]|uniref:Reverse transcriptase domain-containing protein n=1 Tax=Aporhodopirellula rubra TaxID=980271 RepID=A0A7W5H4T3_9BACT|nr:reverse transcriptase domain-containing protein [Aporhodopirellula rubra]MBB3205493.1 hypothetical protein [Aporhodopirellula rubra]
MSEHTFLDWVARGDERFLPTRIDSSSGKFRELDVPKPSDMRIFRMLNKSLGFDRLFHRVAHGGVKRRSSVTSAKSHIKAPFVWVIDVTNCFPSVKFDRFASELGHLGVTPAMQKIIAETLFCRGQIPQGCPTSNLALNLFFMALDYQMAEYCWKRLISFTRMADDIVVGAKERSRGEHAVDKLVAGLAKLDLTVNEKKRAKVGFQPNTGQQLVHSLEISSGSLLLCDEHRNRARQVAEKTVGACRSVQPQSLERAADYRRQLNGWFHYSSQSQDLLTSDLAKAIRVSDNAVKSRLQRAQLDCKRWRWWEIKTATELAARWGSHISV